MDHMTIITDTTTSTSNHGNLISNEISSPTESSSIIPPSLTSITNFIPSLNPISTTTMTSNNISQPTSMFQACAWAHQYWQFRLLLLMAEQQSNVIKSLYSSNITTSNQSSIKLRSSRTHSKWKTSQWRNIRWTEDLKTDDVNEIQSAAPDSNSNDDDNHHFRYRWGRRRYCKAVQKTEKQNKGLSYWNEQIIGCELTCQNEIELVNYLRHLSTDGSPTTFEEGNATEPSISQVDESITKLKTGDDQSQLSQISKSTRQRQPNIIELQQTEFPNWEKQITLFGSRQPFLAQLDQELQSDIFAHAPIHYDHISSQSPSATETTPQKRRRVPYTPPPDEHELQVPQHPLERFPFGLYVRIGIAMVVLGLPTECLMLLVLIAGIHLSGGLDPFLNWFSSFVDRWRNGPAIITNRRPLSQVLAELQQRRQLRRETAALVEQAHRILGQLREVAETKSNSISDSANESSQIHESVQLPLSSHSNTLVDTEIINNIQAKSSSDSSSSNSNSITHRIIHSAAINVYNSDSNIGLLPIDERQNSLVNVDAQYSPNRIEKWLRIDPSLFRFLMIRLDWFIRWFYQSILALLLSLNPSWQPLTAFVSEQPLLSNLRSEIPPLNSSTTNSSHNGNVNEMIIIKEEIKRQASAFSDSVRIQTSVVYESSDHPVEMSQTSNTSKCSVNLEKSAADVPANIIQVPSTQLTDEKEQDEQKTKTNRLSLSFESDCPKPDCPKPD